MNFLKKTIWPVLLATIWIGVSEFLRNELLFKYYWVEHYQDLGLVFPSEPINGIAWGIWSLLFAIGIYIIARRFTLIRTAMLSWLLGFVLMWVAVGNLGVLPFGLLYLAVPLSLLEVFVAAFIIKKLNRIS